MIRTRGRDIVLAFILLEVVQFALMTWVATGNRLERNAVAFTVILCLGLAWRSRIAWMLLVLVNAIPVIAAIGLVASSGSGGTSWGNVAILGLTSAAIEATLLSAPMRRYVTRRSDADHGTPTTTSEVVL